MIGFFPSLKVDKWFTYLYFNLISGVYSDVDFEQSNIQIYIATAPDVLYSLIHNLIISGSKVSDHPDFYLRDLLFFFKILFDVIWYSWVSKYIKSSI